MNIDDRKHVVISSIVPGGAAATDGRLQLGDELLKVNGRSLTYFLSDLAEQRYPGRAAAAGLENSIPLFPDNTWQEIPGDRWAGNEPFDILEVVKKRPIRSRAMDESLMFEPLRHGLKPIIAPSLHCSASPST